MNPTIEGMVYCVKGWTMSLFSTYMLYHCRLASAVVCGLVEVLDPPVLSEAATAQRKEVSAEESSRSIALARRPMLEEWKTCQHLKDAYGLALTVLEKSSDSGAQNAGAALSLADVRYAKLKMNVSP